MDIPFTQYLLPDGRKFNITIGIDDPDRTTKAQSIIDAGGKFEVEVLTTGEVSLTVAYDDDDIAIEIIQNKSAEENTNAVLKLIDSAYETILNVDEDDE